MRTEPDARKRDIWRAARVIVCEMLVPLGALVLTIMLVVRNEPGDIGSLLLLLLWLLHTWHWSDSKENDILSRKRAIMAMCYLDSRIEHGCLEKSKCDGCRKAVIFLAAKEGFPLQW